MVVQSTNVVLFLSVFNHFETYSMTQRLVSKQALNPQYYTLGVFKTKYKQTTEQTVKV
jgi:hypothetical protein